MKTSTAIKGLKMHFPNITGIKPGREWSGRSDDKSIHLGDAAEGGTIGTREDGTPAANYNAGFEDPEEKIYIMGVHRDLEEFLNGMGFHSEWYDAGTLLAYPD